MAGKTPEMIWTKSRDTGGNANPWQVYHKGIGNTKKLYLDATDSIVDTSVWGSTNPTSTVFTLNDNVDDSWMLTSGRVWKDSVISVPTKVDQEVYTFPVDSNRNGHGEKCDMSGEEWIILDASRDPTNVAGHTLYADSSTYEVDYRTGGNARTVSFLGNGFKVHNATHSFKWYSHIYLMNIH